MTPETYTDINGQTIPVQEMQWLEEKTLHDGTECNRYAITGIDGEESGSVWLDEYDEEIDPYK